MIISTLIVDDEPPAREGIALRLRAASDIRLIGECSCGAEAVTSINALRPDLVFLDIRMPDMSGFEVVQKITAVPTPFIVFVTAYDQHALHAFEVHALDYLLKPINDDRFREMLMRVAGEMQHRNLEKYAHTLQSMAAEYLTIAGDAVSQSGQPLPTAPPQYLSRLMVRAKGEIVIIPVSNIDWLESAGDYVYVHAQSRKHLVRETLASLENELDPAAFVRIHRSTMVNVARVRGLRPNEHGDCDLSLIDGTKLKLSRNYREKLEARLRYSI
jgi:two-component system, LytTR family, response regulator